MIYNDRENPLYEHFDRLLEIAKRHDLTLSLGDGLRPGCLEDATDRSQLEELLTIGELRDKALVEGVQVIIEGPGHVPLNQVELNIKIQKEICKGAPFYVLGPLVTDIEMGYDHIAAERQQFNGILVSILPLAGAIRGGLFLPPGNDFYSGILLYDLGDQEAFVKHARFVARTLKLHGVEKIITVDPHTTYALKELYPQYAGVSFEVEPYFALLRPSKVGPGNGRPPVAIHDPCFYGRYLKVSEAPRKLLTGLGLTYTEVRNCGEFTSCCGGPAESVSPPLNREILGQRV